MGETDLQSKRANNAKNKRNTEYILKDAENSENVENIMEKIRLPPLFPEPGIHAL